MAFIDLFIKSEDENSGQTHTVVSTPTESVGSPRNLNIGNQTSPIESVSEVRKTNVEQHTSTQTITADEAIINTADEAIINTADETIINKVWDKIIAANRHGPDYLELKNNVEALDDLPISNEQKLRSAFKVLKKGYPNIKKEDITNAIDFYIKVVDDEKADGLQQLEALKASNVDEVEDEICSMQFRAEVLKRQYDELQTLIDSKTFELTRDKNYIEAKYNSFISSIEAVLNVLNNDKNNIIAINFE